MQRCPKAAVVDRASTVAQPVNGKQMCDRVRGVATAADRRAEGSCRRGPEGLTGEDFRGHTPFSFCGHVRRAPPASFGLPRVVF